MPQFTDILETPNGEVEILVEFDYQPAEEDTGMQESISITAVKYRGINCLEHLSQEQISMLLCQAWNELAWIEEKKIGQEFDVWHNKHKGET